MPATTPVIQCSLSGQACDYGLHNNYEGTDCSDGWPFVDGVDACLVVAEELNKLTPTGTPNITCTGLAAAAGHGTASYPIGDEEHADEIALALSCLYMTGPDTSYWSMSDCQPPVDTCAPPTVVSGVTAVATDLTMTGFAATVTCAPDTTMLSAILAHQPCAAQMALPGRTLGPAPPWPRAMQRLTDPPQLP